MHVINLAAGLDITKNPMESQQSQSPQRHNEYSTTKPSMKPPLSTSVESAPDSDCD
jgi:hypothetical protein